MISLTTIFFDVGFNVVTVAGLTPFETFGTQRLLSNVDRRITVQIAFNLFGMGRVQPRKLL